MSKSFGHQEPQGAWNQGIRAWEELVEPRKGYYGISVNGPGLLTACEELKPAGRMVFPIPHP